MSRSRILDCDFSHADLSNANFESAELVNVHMESVWAVNANFNRAKITNAGGSFKKSALTPNPGAPSNRVYAAQQAMTQRATPTAGISLPRRPGQSGRLSAAAAARKAVHPADQHVATSMGSWRGSDFAGAKFVEAIISATNFSHSIFTTAVINASMMIHYCSLPIP